MLNYQLINTLNLSQETEWEQLVTSVLGDSVHPKRVHGFCLSREALRLCLGERDNHLAITDLVLEKYSAVKGHPSLTISLSHTPEWGAAVVGEVKDFISVGIDIEPMGRIVKPAIVERISHPEDINFNPLSVWSLKEAAFKALMNTQKFPNPVEFSSLKISQGEWTHAPSQIQGEWKLEEAHGLVVALAWIKI
jgi:phosphopantetheinyl transferase (holo-ACP synthase)